jgi:uncharacterized cupredoxin-like copper-binding protein
MVHRSRLVAAGIAAATATAVAGAAAVASGSPHAVVAANTQVLKLSADKSKLKFNTRSLAAGRGTVTLVMANPSGLPHAIAVEGKGIDKRGKTVQKGGTSKLTVTLKKGTYDFYCPVPGHKAAGMQGKLVVK